MQGVETEKCGRKQEAGEGSLSNGKKEKWQLHMPSFNPDGLSGFIPLSDNMEMPEEEGRKKAFQEHGPHLQGRTTEPRVRRVRKAGWVGTKGQVLSPGSLS